MLKIKPRHMFNPFRLPVGGSASLKLSPVVSEDNELIQAIEEAAEYDQWTLTATPDTEQLHSFWASVQDDITNDPEWVQFTEH